MSHTRGDLTPPTPATASGGSSVLTYEPYYGLREKPFTLSSDPRFLYKSPSHASAYESLREAIRRGEGLMALTGDTGTGKTTVCRSVLQGLDRKTVSAFVPDPFVSREDLLKKLLTDFGVASSGGKDGGITVGSRVALSYPLYDFLRTLVPLDTVAVLVIDEAQNLSQSILEELRVLSDLEGPQTMLQVVLLGPRELLTMLQHPRMRQLDQRVSLRCHLDPLDEGSVEAYIAHRLNVASASRHRVNFSGDAIDMIRRSSAGNPRLINLICDRALHYGHLMRTLDISAGIVVEALNERGMAPVATAHDPMTAFSCEDGSTAISQAGSSRQLDPLAGAFASEASPASAMKVDVQTMHTADAPNSHSIDRFHVLWWTAVCTAALLVTAVLLFA